MKIFLTLFMLLINFNAYSQMVVTDPTSLAQTAQNFVQTTANFAKEYGELAAQTANSAKSVEQLTSQYNAITGNLGLNSLLNSYFLDSLANYQNLIEPLPTQRVGGILLDNKKAGDVNKLLIEKVYSTRDDKRQGVYEPLMEKYHTDSAQASLQLFETVIAKAEDDIEKIKKTADTADSNMELKKAVDVNNTLLVQLNLSQQETNQLLAQIGRALVSKEFKGTTSKAKKREKTRLERIKGSTKNTENNVFKLKDSDMPFKRKSRSSVEKFFSGGR